MTGDIFYFDFDSGSAIRGHEEQVEARDAVRHPTMHRAVPPQQRIIPPEKSAVQSRETQY